MSLASRAGDLFYTYKFIKMLTTPFEETEAYELGLIDENGNRIKTERLDSPEKKSAYSPFNRLVFNIKRLLEKIPFGRSKLASYASALFLLKDSYNLTDKNINKILEKSGVEPLDFLTEYTQWFVLEDKRLAPGVYKLYNDKIISESFDDLVKAKDSIRVSNECYPVGEMFGLDIYEVEHIQTSKKIHVTVGELYK